MQQFFASDPKKNAAGEYRRLDVRPYAGSLGAEVHGVDLRKVDEETFAEIRRASADHLVLFFRGQSLEPGDLEAFSGRLGPFGDDPFAKGMEDHPNVVRVLKEADERHPFVFGAVWHSDWSFQECPPAYTLLYAHELPPYGGDTLYANMYLAYEALSEALQGVMRGLQAWHSPEMGYGPDAHHNKLLENMTIPYGDAAKVIREHPVVRKHPDTGRRALFVNPAYTVGFKDMKPEESRAILDYLYEVAMHPAHTCRFRWTTGDLAMWDNRCTWHNPVPDYHGFRREMYRTTVHGEKPLPG